MSAPAAPAVQKGIVKQVLSGDSVVIRGQPKGGPPPERTLCLSNITAPRLARRPNPNAEGVPETKDEPCAWEAREFLRKKLVGKEVLFTVEYKVPASNREYGVVLIPSKDGGTPENVTESLVEAGLVEVRRGSKASDENQQKLVQLEDTAKSAGRGKWASDASTRVRNIKWTVEDPRKFVDSHHQKPIDAVIEHVRDGCTVRAFLLPEMDYVTVLLSGVKCPMFKQDGTPEPFADEAKFYVESRLLQRDVQIVLEGVSNQNLLGTVLHPNGNITELLLKDGFARCVDWSMGSVTCGAEKYRAAEKAAKDKQLRIWKDYKPPSSAIEIKEKSFQGKVIEVVNGDSLVVKVGNDYKKVFLSSIRPPRPQAAGDAAAAEDGVEAKPVPVKSARERPRPLYDVPYMFEAREFLRKKLVGHKVNVTVDYIQPASNNYPEKIGCTVMSGNINVAEALVSKGLATVIRYRQDDDHRSSHYDELLAAEARALKKGVGLHSKSEPPMHRVADVTGGDIQKAKQFLPFLQRADRSDALVEFVASGSRLRLYIPRETCLVTFLISGVQCPRGARPAVGGNEAVAGEPFGEEAHAFTREMCMQREVQIKVEAMDKGGNFIGWLFVDGVNLSQALVEQGLARVHSSAFNTPYQRQLEIAEEKAKGQKLGLWQSFVEEIKEAVEAVEENTDRRVNYVPVVITEVSATDLSFYAQSSDNGPQFEKFMNDLRTDLEQNPPLPGAYTPRKGDTCAAKFSGDGQWYRARVEKIDGGNITVVFTDFGNKETTTSTKLAPLPAAFHGLAPQAREYHLALAQLPSDEEAKADAQDHFYQNIANKDCLLNVEYKVGSVDYVTLLYADTKDDVALGMIQDGLILAEGRREKRLAKLVGDYRQAQDAAKKNRMNLWRYGDITEDDAKEFGYQR